MNRKKLLIISLTMLTVCGILLFKAVNNNSLNLYKASASEQIKVAYQQNKPVWLLFRSKT